MSDIVERLHCTIRCDIETAASGCHCAEGRDVITALRAENEDLGNRLHHVHRLWANSEHALRAENERLRAALETIYKRGLCNQGGAYKSGFYANFKTARLALGIPHMSFDVARAALEERT